MKTKPDLFFKTDRERKTGETSQQTADQIQAELIELVDEFCTYSPTGNPISFINDMLERWLRMPSTSVVKDGHDKMTLRMGQEMIYFITALNVHLKDLRYFQQQAELEQGREVGNE